MTLKKQFQGILSKTDEAVRDNDTDFDNYMPVWVKTRYIEWLEEENNKLKDRIKLLLEMIEAIKDTANQIWESRSSKSTTPT